MNYIITASTKYGSITKMLKILSSNTRVRLPANLTEVTGTPVYARVNYGRWLADCQCGGAELVDPKDKRFFCFSCGNAENNNKLRPVIFPENYLAIEDELLKRPARKVNDFVQSGPGELPREFRLTETLADLKAQRLTRHAIEELR